MAKDIVLKDVADLSLQMMRPGAKRKLPVLVTIWVYQQDDDDWYCSVRLMGLDDRKGQRIFGVDPWQALTRALRFVEVMLRREVRKGNQFFYLGHKTSVGKLCSILLKSLRRLPVPWRFP